MNVFLCHASEDKDVTEKIQLALVGAGFEVFFDEQSLPPGSDYQARIREAISRSEIFVFIATRHSLAQGKYTLTELRFARKKWPHPAGRVVSLNLHSLAPHDLPNYLQAAALLKVEGNPAAEVRAVVEDLRETIRSTPIAPPSVPQTHPAVRQAETLLESPNGEERERALRALCGMDSDEAIGALARAADRSPYPQVRIKAVLALARRGDARASDGLVQILSEKKWLGSNVQFYEIELALDGLGRRDCATVLTRAA